METVQKDFVKLSQTLQVVYCAKIYKNTLFYFRYNHTIHIIVYVHDLMHYNICFFRCPWRSYVMPTLRCAGRTMMMLTIAPRAMRILR